MRILPSRSISVALLCLSLHGCRQESPRTSPVEPGTRQDSLKVWVIMGSLPNEVIGRRQNAGCRLTSQELMNHIGDLQADASFFGNGTTFPWDGQFNIVNFSNLIIFDTNGNRRRNGDQFEEEVFGAQNKWTAGHVNVYFCGAIDPDNDSTNDPGNIPAPGFNRDPQFFPRPYIVINDGGPWNAAGWSAHADDRILEHEMTHFMGRFKNRTFGGYEIGGQSVGLTYDSEEHTPEEPVEWKLLNILYGGGWPYALRIGNSEKGEIVVRIQQGNWTNP